MSRAARTILYLAVLLAALAPLLTGGVTEGWVRPGAQVRALARAVDDLAPNSSVLLSFDYEPSYAGELDALALAVMRHLASRSASMVVMSTKPGGIGMAQRAYRTLASEWPAYRAYGDNYALLGYLPAQQTGLRSLAESFQDTFKSDCVQQSPLCALRVTRGLATLDDFDQVIILADDSETVRRWVEQVGSRRPLILHALVTARIKPLLVPYEQAGQLQTLIAGTTEAAEYEMAAGIEPLATRLSDGYALLFVIVVLVAIITNFRHPAHRA